MKIVVISDTHLSRKSRKLPTRLLDVLPSADLILHLRVTGRIGVCTHCLVSMHQLKG